MKKMRKICGIVLLVALFLFMPMEQAYASTKSDAANVLKYYKKGQISKAKKYNKRLATKASKASIKKLSKKAKTAYRKTVQRYKLDNYSDSLWGYYLADLDGDKKAELLVKHGSCEADVRTTVYKYTNGKAKKVGEFYSGHTSYYAYPGHSGIISVWGHMGGESVDTISLKKGKIVAKNHGSREVGSGDFFPFRQALDGHIRFDKRYHPSIDWKDLK